MTGGAVELTPKYGGNKEHGSGASGAVTGINRLTIVPTLSAGSPTLGPGASEPIDYPGRAIDVTGLDNTPPTMKLEIDQPGDADGNGDPDAPEMSAGSLNDLTTPRAAA